MADDCLLLDVFNKYYLLTLQELNFFLAKNIHCMPVNVYFSWISAVISRFLISSHSQFVLPTIYHLTRSTTIIQNYFVLYSFLESGANIVITASYQVNQQLKPFGFLKIDISFKILFYYQTVSTI